jgi:hypothetical protein
MARWFSEKTTPIRDTFSDAPKSCRKTVVSSNLGRLNGCPLIGAAPARSIKGTILESR